MRKHGSEKNRGKGGLSHVSVNRSSSTTRTGPNSPVTSSPPTPGHSGFRATHPASIRSFPRDPVRREQSHISTLPSSAIWHVTCLRYRESGDDMKSMTLSLCAFLALASAPAWGHGGRTNAEGCHNDRKNGGYHCHNGGAGPSRSPLPASFAPGRGAGLSGSSYANCTAARAAGAAPVRRGEPGYGAHLDRDSDGVGCE